MARSRFSMWANTLSGSSSAGSISVQMDSSKILKVPLKTLGSMVVVNLVSSSRASLCLQEWSWGNGCLYHHDPE